VNARNFFAELKRRNVYKVAVAYTIVAWLLMQIASQIFPFFDIPNWAVRFVVLLLILGFPVALILAWAFELTPEGIKRVEDVAPNESITGRTGRKLDFLLQEMNHRVNNSLQVIASILLLKAQTVQSEETRQHLREAHERVRAVATVQEQLHPSPFGLQIEVRTYLTRLCESLAASMTLDSQPVSLRVDASEGETTSEHAVSMGLITTELVINALKHAFPGGA
jgi:two-component sensor histidine kinase